MRIVVLSNTTMQPLERHLPPAEVVFSGVADVPTWLLDRSSAACDPRTDVVILHVDGDSLVPPIGRPELAEMILDIVEAYADAHPATQVIVTTLLPQPRSAASYADALDPTGSVAIRSL